MGFPDRIFGRAQGDKDWARAFLALWQQMDKIVYSVHDAMQSKSQEAELIALREAVEKLPRILDDMRNLSEPTSARRREAKDYFVQGVEIYLSACQHGMKWLGTQDQEEVNQAVAQINQAGELMDKSSRLMSY
jgi:superfamily II DNA helicase RecQ